MVKDLLKEKKTNQQHDFSVKTEFYIVEEQKYS